MQMINLDYIKAHSRIDEITSGSAEESLLELYGESAEQTVLNYLERSIEELYELWGCIPAPVMQACLLLVDQSYQFRTPMSTMQLYRVDYSFDALLKPYMKL